MLIGSGTGILRTVLIGVLAYAALVALLRVSGKRTLSKWNAFDLVVTVALGSSLATTLLSKTVALAEGVAAFALLILLQFAVTSLSVRWRSLEQTVKARPALLLHRGRFRDDALRRERVTRAEVLAALRGNGVARVEDAGAVVLETDGSFSVIRLTGEGPASALTDVEGCPDAPDGAGY